MASKGKAKFQNQKSTRKSTTSYEGAIDNAYFVEALMKNSQWKLARIIDCRLQKDFDLKRKKIDSSYEYYVHYEDYNRRMDEWVPKSRIRLTDKIIEEEPEIKKNQKIEAKKSEFEENDEHEGMDQASLRAHEEVTRFKTISQIQLGDYRCETWYFSPYPQGFHNIDCLYICEYCLSFYAEEEELQRHIKKCTLTHPPGNEIYRHNNISMFEVDGFKNTTYCENLCYLSKLFLDHKNLYYDIEPFLFFVMTENNETGHHLVGYFSKEKESQSGYNLSCIMTLPFHQRKGFGKFLITFSYELSLIEGKVGTPERPLSDLGRQSYLSWWTQRIVDYMTEKKDQQFSINDITSDTGIKEKDIIWTLEQKGLIKYGSGQIYLCTDEKILKQVHKLAGRPGLPVEPKKIHWIPFKFKYETQN